MVWLPDDENNWKMWLLVLTEFANVTGGFTDRLTPHYSIVSN